MQNIRFRFGIAISVVAVSMLAVIVPVSVKASDAGYSDTHAECCYASPLEWENIDAIIAILP